MKARLTHIAFLLAGVLVVALQAPLSAHASTADDDPMAVVRPGFDLRLVGTAVSDQSEKSLAVVEIGDRLQVYLREGDTIGKVLIKSILYDQVIVDDGKGEKKIKLRQSLSEGVIIQAEASRSPAPLFSFGPRPPEVRNFQAVFLDREAAEAVFADIDGALNDAQINSVSVYGRPTGVRIAPIVPGSVFAEIGLKSGEIVREVNGRPIFDPEEAVALLKQMKNGGEFDIKVKGRRSRQIHLIVE